MKDFYSEKIKVLAERNGWSPAHSKGYVDGETSRRRGKALSTYVQVGIDEYCLGFRAGYYERKVSPATRPGNAVAPSSARPFQKS